VQTPDPAVLLSQAKQFFDALDYEHAVTALDQAIVVLEGRPLQDPVRRGLPGAYEMRARSRFGLGSEADARADFVALLKADPVYTLTGQVSPRVVAIPSGFGAYRQSMIERKLPFDRYQYVVLWC